MTPTPDRFSAALDWTDEQIKAVNSSLNRFEPLNNSMIKNYRDNVLPALRAALITAQKVPALVADLDDALQRYDDGTKGADGTISLIEYAIGRFKQLEQT